MYRILIVDDEPMIVEGLATLLEEQESMELEVHKTCLAGQAMKILDRLRIDILLTDIRMPVTSGIELMQHVRLNWPECRILFLTAFEEFEYAYTALKNPGVRFLLKTEGHNAVIQAVKECVDELKREMDERSQLKRSHEQTEILRALQVRELWSRLLHGEESWSSQRALAELEIDLSADEPLYLLLGAPASPRDDSLSHLDMFADLLSLRLGERMRCSVYKAGSQLFAWLMQPGPSLAAAQTLPELLADELDAMDAPCKNGLVFVLAGQPVPWNEMFCEYRSLKLLLQRQSSKGEQMIYVTSGTEDTPPQETAILHIRELCAKEIRLLKTNMDSGDRAAFSLRLDGICDTLPGIIAQRQEFGRELSMELNLVFLTGVNRMPQSRLSPELRSLSKELIQSELSVPLPKAQYLAIGQALFDQQDETADTQAQYCVEKVKKYIREHLDDDLSLTKLAQLSRYNPKYLSDLFRTQTGATLSAYIAEQRLGEAKRLMAEGKLKIKDISAAVGFFSTSYFTRFFKKGTGMTPMQYLETIAEKNWTEDKNLES